MLQNDDLEAAIGVGIVTQAQADALLAFVASRRGGAAALRADEERFRFMRGFNDFFFAVGVALLGVGLALFAGMKANPIVYGLSAFVMWGLAELLVRQMRLVLPGIVIVGFFVALVALALPFANFIKPTPGQFVSPASPVPSMVSAFLGYGNQPQAALNAAIMGVAAAVFYARFRFPFALLIVAAGTVVAFELTVSHFVFNDSATAHLLLLLLSGLAVFGIAMRFDLSDRLRATRRSDCAFWLHVLAAPLLVHSLVGLVSGNTFRPENFAAGMIVVIALLLTVVALIIDRRALLMSALVYVGSAIAFALSRAAVDSVFILIATLVILGVLVLALGVGWAPLRRRVMSLLSSNVVDRLPPVVPA